MLSLMSKRFWGSASSEEKDQILMNSIIIQLESNGMKIEGLRRKFERENPHSLKKYFCGTIIDGQNQSFAAEYKVLGSSVFQKLNEQMWDEIFSL